MRSKSRPFEFSAWNLSFASALNSIEFCMNSGENFGSNKIMSYHYTQTPYEVKNQISSFQFIANWVFLDTMRATLFGQCSHEGCKLGWVENNDFFK